MYMCLQIAGLATNIPFLMSLCDHGEFIKGNVNTDFIATHREALFAKLSDQAAISDEIVCSALSTLMASELDAQQLSSNNEAKDKTLTNYWTNAPMTKTYEIAFSSKSSESSYICIFST